MCKPIPLEKPRIGCWVVAIPVGHAAQLLCLLAHFFGGGMEARPYTACEVLVVAVFCRDDPPVPCAPILQPQQDRRWRERYSGLRV